MIHYDTTTLLHYTALLIYKSELEVLADVVNAFSACGSAYGSAKLVPLINRSESVLGKDCCGRDHGVHARGSAGRGERQTVLAMHCCYRAWPSALFEWFYT